MHDAPKPLDLWFKLVLGVYVVVATLLTLALALFFPVVSDRGQTALAAAMRSSLEIAPSAAFLSLSVLLFLPSFSSPFSLFSLKSSQDYGGGADSGRRFMVLKS